MKRTFLFSALAASMLGAMAQGGYQDGIDYFKADYPEEAAIILTKTINDSSADKALSYYYLGAIDLRKNDKAAALANFDKGIAANPECGYNYIGKGQIELLNGNESAAEKLFKQGISSDKKEKGALCAAVARAYFNVNPIKYAKKIEKYIADGDKASKFKESDLFVLRGDMVVNNAGESAGQYETAIVTDEEVGAPVSPEAYVKYARVYFHVNPEYAINKLIELNKKLPNSALAQRELAEKYYDNNQLTLAAEQYGKYMSNPNHFERDEQRYSGLLFFGKKYAKSLEIAEKVLAKNPDNFYMQRMVMYNLYELKCYDKAEAAAKKFFAMVPKDQIQPKDYEYEGDILMELKQYEAAVEAYKQCETAFPDRTDVLDELAAAYNSASQFELAAKTMQRFIDTGDRSLNDLWDCADYYKNWGLSLPEGSEERAAAAAAGIKVIDQAIERQPKAGQLYRTKSQLFQVGNATPNMEAADAYKKMIECYEAAGEKEKRQAQIVSGLMYIGSYYAANKDMESARSYYQQALDLDPSNEGLAKYIQTLK